MDNRKTRGDLLAVGMFPILLDITVSSEGKACVPLELVMAHEQQAVKNHGQSVSRLAERGGLSPSELAAVLWDREWRPMEIHEAWNSIFRAAAIAKDTTR